MRAIITVGLGFGDEGKGATVDYLARTLGADLVVRYSGGAQAGHNVELPDGRRHTFSQFGAGTLAGVRTWLGPQMIISPATMVPEAEHLRTLGVADPIAMLSMHPDCLVSTLFHISLNRLREISRGRAVHGSCGLGIGETRRMWLEHGADAVTAGDLQDRPVLIGKLRLLRDRCLLEMQQLGSLDPGLADLLYDTYPEEEADELQAAVEGVTLSQRMPAANLAIFEGAQGVLLDEWKGFHPYTTWSTVTTRQALELAAEHGITDITTLGLTRAYHTRHGAGPFPTYSAEMSAALTDPGNLTNRWQGTIRTGPLDLMLLRYALRACPVDGLVVSGLDQVGESFPIGTSYEGIDQLPQPHSLAEQEQLTDLLNITRPIYQTVTQEELRESLAELAPVVITAHGPTWRDRTWETSQRTLVAGVGGR